MKLGISSSGISLRNELFAPRANTHGALKKKLMVKKLNSKEMKHIIVRKESVRQNVRRCISHAKLIASGSKPNFIDVRLQQHFCLKNSTVMNILETEKGTIAVNMMLSGTILRSTVWLYVLMPSKPKSLAKHPSKSRGERHLVTPLENIEHSDSPSSMNYKIKRTLIYFYTSL